MEVVTKAQTQHEVALHGVTHVPWSSMDEEFVQSELALFSALKGPIRESRTFVFPRNLVAHEQMLRTFGFLGYRASLAKRSRAASLAAEFDLSVQPDDVRRGDGLIVIPAGFFLNWRSGLRRLVPPAITLQRARVLLDRAERSARVVHLWLHPENVATAPDTFHLLRRLIDEVARRRDAGRCAVLTQVDYCQ